MKKLTKKGELGESNSPLSRLKNGHKLYPYLFISPFYIVFLVFGLFPILFSVYISFYKWSGFGVMSPVGITNYYRVIHDPLFWQSIRNVIFLWLGHIFILIILAFALAVILNSDSIIGRNIYRAIVYLPNVTSVAAMALVFSFVFDNNFGILNMFLHQLGIESIPWLLDPLWAKISIIGVNIWEITGWYMLIFLSGLKTIDPTIFEAAKLDGAGFWFTVRYIMIPIMKKMIAFVFLLETIGSLQIFTEPYIITKGGPLNGTLTPVLYLYQQAFEYHKMGYASSISILLFVLTSITLIILWSIEKDN